MTVSELIQKNGQLTGLALKSKIGKDETLPVSGLFVALGGLPDTQVLVGLATLDENGYVFTDEKWQSPKHPDCLPPETAAKKAFASLQLLFPTARLPQFLPAHISNNQNNETNPI